MIFTKNIISLLFGVIATSQQVASTCTSIESITCVPVSEAPTLDGNTGDWSAVEKFEVPLTGALPPHQAYAQGNGSAKIQCVYDSDRIYFLFEVPGVHRFSSTDNKKCASISTMFKMGELASLYNMGNCPMAGDCDAAPEGCDPYKVDLGGHWELKTTEMGVFYGPNDSTGNDLAANKDDEYAVGPYCRFDDDDVKAANEWEGAWLHTSPAKIERDATVDDDGSYIFEMSRSLKTASMETDAQLEAGKAIDFGVAYWDPYETGEDGWTDAGHYVSGCSKEWTSLRLVDENGEISEEDGDVFVEDQAEEESTASSASTAVLTNVSIMYGVTAASFAMMNTVY